MGSFLLFMIAASIIYLGYCVIDFIISRSGRPSSNLIPPPPARKPEPNTIKGLIVSMKLTMKVVIRWEQLLGRSFSCMDYKSQSDVEALIYCSMLCNNPNMTYTLEEFTHTLKNDKISRDVYKAFARESSVINQFQTNTESGNSSESGTTPGYIKDIVSMLIMSGLDANFAMNMELCDMPLFIAAYQSKRKEQMESDRLWTYLTILPHVDGKKLSSARDLYPFPWEEEESKQEAEQFMEDQKENLSKFLSGGMFDMNSINWKSN